ncbi:MAG TPA: hypothetical protein DCP28_04750, partial [Cytophagales bacterium]|nr:hypothetical protein [Cytophagales bacterium]
MAYRQTNPAQMIKCIPMFWLIAAGTLMMAALPAAAQNGQSLQRMLTDATLQFQAGEEEELLKLFSRFNRLDLDSARVIDPGISRNDWEEVYTAVRELEAEYWLRLRNQDRADSVIQRLFDRNPAYRAKSTASQGFRSRVDVIRSNRVQNLSYTVSKKAEAVGLEPAFTIIITQAQLYERGYTHLEELFHDLPGFAISGGKGRSFSALYQRGYHTEMGTDRTLLLVDGAEDNELFTGLAYLSRQYPLTNIRQVEVVYGPMSSLYGANAFGGVINIVTQAGSQGEVSAGPWRGQADLGTGTWNTQFADITVSKVWPQLQFSATARLFQSDEMPQAGFEETDQFSDGQWSYDGLEAQYRERLAITDPLLGEILQSFSVWNEYYEEVDTCTPVGRAR